MQRKHAYLIIAHNNFYVLERTLKLIDDKRNDIFIHMDKKVKNFDFEKYSALCNYSKVFFTKKRYNVKWGHSSQVKIEMLLFKTAYEHKYDYYHLISGSDMPLKSQDYIHSFFDQNRYEYIVDPSVSNEYNFRLSKYHINATNHLMNNIKNYFDVVQDKFRINRLKKYNFKIYKGSNWVSISHECVGYLLSKKRLISKMTRFTLCADEVYKQTLIMDSPLASKLYKGKDIRLIDWDRNEGYSPHTFTIEDYEMIKNSDCLFARKFVAEKDREIVDMVYDMVRDR